jgi:hypothetical protein
LNYFLFQLEFTPPGTVVAAHRSAPPPLPCSAGRATCHAALPAHATAGPLPVDAAPLRCPTPHPGPLSLPRSRHPHGDHPRTPLLCLAASASKAARRRRARLSFSLPRSPTCTAKRPASRPHRRSSHRGPHRRVSDHRRRRFSPTVRPSQSADIFHFGAALTSLVLPCSSRS